MKEVYGFLSFITKTRKHTHTCKRREKVKVEGSEVEASALFSSLLYFFLINSPSSYFTNTRVDVPSSSILTLITGRKYPKDTNKQRNNNKKQVFWQCFAHVYASASLCFFFSSFSSSSSLITHAPMCCFSLVWDNISNAARIVVCCCCCFFFF